MTTPNHAQATALSVTGLALVVALIVGASGGAPAPADGASPGGVGPAIDWAAAVESGTDHVLPEDLAARMMRGDDILVIDVRPADEFASGFRLRGSVNLTIPDLLGARGDALLASRPAADVVLVSNGMTHPAQAWTELVRRGRARAFVLEDGLDGFRARVLTPPSLRSSGAVAGGDVSTARAFFLAAPTVVDPAATPPAPTLASVPTTAPTTAPKPPQTGRFATDPARLEAPTLVSTAWVARRAADVVLLDARVPAAQFAAGHLAGARHVPIEALRTTVGGVPEELKPPADLAAAFGAFGIGDETEVVVYADDKLQDAAHAVLALVSAGHRRAAIMEGGIAAWKAEGRSVTTDVVAPVPAKFTVRAAHDLVRASIDDVARASRDRSVPIVDVRPGDAFRGETSTEARPGHIPSSVNHEFTDDFAKTPAGVYWRPGEELSAGWTSAGAKPGGPVIVTCRTGHQAALAWFTLRWIVGREDVRWYDGSWKEWASRSDLPAEMGAVPLPGAGR